MIYYSLLFAFTQSKSVTVKYTSSMPDLNLLKLRLHHLERILRVLLVSFWNNLIITHKHYAVSS